MKTLHFILTLLVLTFVGCGEGDEKPNTLSVNPGTVSIAPQGGTSSITISTDASSWTLTNPGSDWLTASAMSGSGSTSTITLTVSSRSAEARTATLQVTAGTAKPVEVKVTQALSQYLYSLSSNLTILTFNKGGGSSPISITSDAAQWSISSDSEWLQVSKSSGSSGTSQVTVTAQPNSASGARTATITLSADHAPTVSISVTQQGDLYPGYNLTPLGPDMTGMTSTAQQIASAIKIGWNMGNSLEAVGSETAWGNPKATKALFDRVKASGFNAVRLPCSWNQYMANTTTAQLKATWLNRVKEVVQYAVDNDMYVILNIHWDGGWLENNCKPEKQEENNAKQKAFWEQIATHLRDFDEHLMFASANEPNVSNAQEMEVLMSYHQTFVDAVRATGGRNSYRTLVVQGPSTDIDKTDDLMSTLPVDEVQDRMMVEIHYYSPWNFCGMTEDQDWGNQFYYWGKGNHSTTDTDHNPTWGEEDYVDAEFLKMKTKFVDKGIPVVLGEYAPTRRSALTGDNLTLHLQSRAYYLKYVTQKALENGVLPFYWDSGGLGNNASGIFDRATNTVFDQQALTALMEGAQ